MKIRSRSLLFVSLIGALGLSTQSHAETTECTVINSVPIVITTQGVYCFKHNISTNIADATDKAIDIQTNNVTIDFNGFKLGGLLAGKSSQAEGVYADDRSNITLINGNIRGFYRGIHLAGGGAPPYDSSGGHVIEKNRLDGNLRYGIRVQGKGNTVRDNLVINTGGSTLGGISSTAFGIVASGPGVVVSNNTVNKTVSSESSSAYGILLSNSEAGLVLNNRVSMTENLDSGSKYGIYINNDNKVSIEGNTVINDAEKGTTAIRGSLSGLCSDNKMIHFSVALSNCFNGGGNIGL